jgi:hypothetical protein
VDYFATCCVGGNMCMAIKPSQRILSEAKVGVNIDL